MDRETWSRKCQSHEVKEKGRNYDLGSGFKNIQISGQCLRIFQFLGKRFAYNQLWENTFLDIRKWGHKFSVYFKKLFIKNFISFI